MTNEEVQRCKTKTVAKQDRVNSWNKIKDDYSWYAGVDHRANPSSTELEKENREYLYTIHINWTLLKIQDT
ncbi:Hypothetical protein HVR_LOCUS942 [uncultured virus]|nr:Hypothetical protein HVR_LOCUS942 [uncultured virus]